MKKILTLLVFSCIFVQIANASNRDIFAAAASGDFLSIISLYNDKEPVDKKGNSPLILAAENGYLEIVQFLVERGADVNRQNHYGYTPLFSSAVNAHADTMSILLEHGADEKLSNIFHSSVLDYVRSQGFADMPAYIEYLKSIKKSVLKGPNSFSYLRSWHWKLYTCTSAACTDNVLEDAVRRRSPDALLYMGKALLDKDEDRALLYFTEANERESLEARYILGKLYTDGFFPKKPEEGFRYLETSFAALCASPTNKVVYLGRAYMIGIGTKADAAKAIECFDTAIKAGNWDGLYFKGVMKYFGLGVKEDKPEGLREILKARDLSSPLASEQTKRFNAWELFRNLKTKSNKKEIAALVLSYGGTVLMREDECDAYSVANILNIKNARLLFCQDGWELIAEIDAAYKEFLLNYETLKEKTFFAR